MPNLSLFPDPPTPITPASDRPEPALWIRRLQIVAGLSPESETIREVTFRRGLNIIRTAERPTDETRPVGHSVGKTLLLRLIRYCLGESAFCTRPVRERIVQHLPGAYVLAEFILQGQPWIVARPIGVDSHTASWSMQSDDFSAIRQPGPRKRHSEFTSVLESTLTQPISHVTLSNSRRAPLWLDMLGWLARDQECRFARHNEWREPDAESSPRLPREDASLLIRAIMDLLDQEELQLRRQHAELHRDHDQLERDQVRLEAFLSREQSELRELAEVTGDIPDGPMLAEHVRTTSNTMRATLESSADQQAGSDVVANAEQQLQTASDAVAAANGELQAIRNLLGAELLALDQKKNETGPDNYLDLEPKRPWCRLYMDKSNAVQDGCPGGDEIHQPTVPDPYRQARIEEIEASIASLRQQIENLELLLPDLESQKFAAAQTMQLDRATRQLQQRQLWQQIGHHRSLVDRATRYGQAWNSFANLAPKITAKEQQIAQSLADQSASRHQLETKLHTLSAHFDTTLKALLGNQVGGQVEINARGILPCPDATAASTGAALSTSSTVLGFDIACLIASICGLGCHPRFLMHDSPREADMEEAIYHSQLRFARHLESLFGDHEPSFQYIVTTTTLPPAELTAEPFIRLTLDARADSTRLLGVHF